jgi:hypothetical protein
MAPTRPIPLVAVALALMATAPEARAQSPLTLQGRVGAMVPVAGFRSGPGAAEELSAALSFGVAFALEGPGGRHLLVGFSQHRLRCRGGACGGEGEYVSTAWDVGYRFDFGSGARIPWARLALTFPRVEVDGVAAAESDATRLGIGVEAGAGLRFAVGGPFYLSPGVRFGAADADLRGPGRLRMRYLVADVGLVVGF